MNSNEKKIVIPGILKPCFDKVQGMDDLKKTMVSIYNIQNISKKRNVVGFSTEYKQLNNNILIEGAKGSGRTTAAHIVGDCYYKLGIANSKEPITTDYQSLLSTSAAETAENVKNLVESAVDRLIVIENVEEFNDQIPYSPGLEILDQLVEAYESTNGSFTIIATGDKSNIAELLKKKQNFAKLFNIPAVSVGDYSEEELLKLCEMIAEKMGYVIEPGAEKILVDEYNKKLSEPEFNHLKLFEEMIIEASMNAAIRLSRNRNLDEVDVALLKSDDFVRSDSDENDSESLEELLDELDSMIGLKNIKEHIRVLISDIEMKPLNEKAGIKPLKETMHLVFYGAPGTGKTTVARLFGKIYKKLGLLTRGQFVEVKRNDLVSDIIGGTAIKVHDTVQKALGGILFIDEAYSLCRDEYDSFGKEAVDTLTAEIYDHKDNLVCIIAGYENEIYKFLSQNPGLKSRFPTKILFENYSLSELFEILLKYIDGIGMLLHPDAEDAAKEILTQKAIDPDFGNARGVENLFCKIVHNHQKRIVSLGESKISNNDIKIITEEDMIEHSDLSSRDKSLQACYDELESLVGLDSVKELVRQMASSIRVNMLRKKRGIKIKEGKTLHLVFKGHAGTGKTTVARLIGRIYKELGVLSSGKFVECTRSDLVGRVQGETAIKMKSKIKEAIGGVLFIDEAYSLTNDPYDGYGKEAVNELVAGMDNNRDNLMVIIAGYPDKIDEFIKSNEGLSSRFSQELYFDDYNKLELRKIFIKLLNIKSLKLEATANVHNLLSELFTRCMEIENFGNARGVRNIVEQLSSIQDSRIDRLLTERVDDEVTNDILQLVTEEDIKKLMNKLNILSKAD